MLVDHFPHSALQDRVISNSAQSGGVKILSVCSGLEVYSHCLSTISDDKYLFSESYQPPPVVPSCLSDLQNTENFPLFVLQ